MTARNDPCPCGSGKRYKQCCGRIGGEASTVEVKDTSLAASDFMALMQRALAAQRAADTAEAERLYEAALTLHPDSFDALHMLGVLRLQSGDAESALQLLVNAAPHAIRGFAAFPNNLGLCIAGVIRKRRQATDMHVPISEMAFRRFLRPCALAPLPLNSPLVSIIVDTASQVDAMERAVKSIADQTYRKIEIIALLPGSDRIAREAIEAVLAATDLPYFLVPVTSDRVNDALGAGLAAATGEYASYLKGDMYSQTRIEHMLRTLEATGALWGFSNVAFSSAEGNPLAFGVDPVVDAVMRLYDSLYTRHQILESLLEHDQIQFLGNIFARRAAWLDISKSLSGHEREYCWALSFQLGLLSEPAYLDAPGYIHVVGTRTDADSGGPSATSLEMLMAWHRQATQEARQIEVRQRYWQHVLSKLGSQPLSQGQLMDYAAQLGFTS